MFTVVVYRSRCLTPSHREATKVGSEIKARLCLCTGCFSDSSVYFTVCVRGRGEGREEREGEREGLLIG